MMAKSGAGLPVVRILTPVRNGEDWIRDTVLSVVRQRAVLEGRVRLDYTILDGASSDRTVERAREAAGDLVEIISEPDSGVYDALARGFRARSGDICGYVNAGDMLFDGAFEVLADVMSSGRVQWVCGYNVHFTAGGAAVGIVLPFRYSRRAISVGFHAIRLPIIQQESTFWSGRLMSLVDLERLAASRLAGDFYLWHTFAQRESLYVVDALLGGFRHHGDHLSDQVDAYLAEVDEIADRPSLGDYLRTSLDRWAWRAPVGIKKRLNRNELLLFDNESATWQ